MTLSGITLASYRLRPVTLSGITLASYSLKPMTLSGITLACYSLRPVTLSGITLVSYSLRPVTLPGVGQWDKTYSCYTSRQTLTSPSDTVFCPMRTAQARFRSDNNNEIIMKYL